MSMTINQPTTTTTKTTTMSSLLGWTGGQLHCQRVVRQFDTIVTIEGNQFRYCAEYLFNTQPHITAVTRSKVVGYVKTERRSLLICGRGLFEITDTDDSPPHTLLNSSLSSSPLSSSITPSCFHSRLKTYLFNKSFPS